MHHVPLDSCGALRVSDATLELELLNVGAGNLNPCFYKSSHYPIVEPSPAPKKCFSDFLLPFLLCFFPFRDLLVPQ